MNPRLVMRWSPGARSVFAPALAMVPLLASIFLSCTPELPAPRPAEPSVVQADGGADLQLEPSSPLDAALPVLRFHLRLAVAATDEVDVTRVMLIRGKVTPAHLRQIEKGELSKALTARVVPAIVWLDNTPFGETWATVAPTVALAPDEVCSVIGGNPLALHEVRIAAEGVPPFLPRIWPPVDNGATLALGVWCGEEPLPESTVAAALAPGGPHGELRRGAVDDTGTRCLRFEASPSAETYEASQGGFVGPPSTGGEAPWASLDPRPFMLAAEPMPAVAVPCEPGEVPFGPGCADVMDDRILVRSAGAPLLWAIANERIDEVVAARSDEPFFLAPLPPLTALTLSIATVDNAGHVERDTFSTRTLAPMPHVIINEVLANPLGSEPAQEWVELYNDGLVTAELAGYVLKDVGGETALPAGSLAPGAFALIINEVYADDDELDPSPPRETLLLRVSKLGNHGLSNMGEPLSLVNGEGAVLSRAPAMSASKAGMSLTRMNPHAPDGLAGSFVSSWPTPGRENIIKK